MNTSILLLIRPHQIRSNEETASNNYYQQVDIKNHDYQTLATKEFDNLVRVLKEADIEVLVYQITDQLDTPDAHFPNNWISFHENETVALYPMFAPNRRLERRKSVLGFVKQNGFSINKIVDYSPYEKDLLFLEGTGSLVLDRQNKIAYCALSERSNNKLLEIFCDDFNYKAIAFTANQTVNQQRKAIYHTNVMMCIADTFAVICLACIDDEKERNKVITQLKASNKTIIELTEYQLTHFAGNMLQVSSKKGKKYLVMSSAAYQCLTPQQIQQIESHCAILHVPIPTIEKLGGGSVRCMMAEMIS
ncbi:MAG: amidinotransferase [Flavobacteriales bacterium]|nr:amidinotransferase [Flavobacteriales bacterium]